MFHRRIPAFVVMSLIAFPAALGVHSSSASASVGCNGSGCNGKSPVATRCERDAVSLNFVVFEDHASGGTFGRQVVTLRFSPRCKASWSRVTASAGGTAAVTQSTAFVNRYSSKTKRSLKGPGTIYSKMRSGKVRACGTTYFNGNAVVETRCVSARQTQ